MNAFLARGLGSLNAVIAVLIVVAYTFVAGFAAMDAARGIPEGANSIGYGLAGAVLGFIVGLVVACLVCGIIAVLIGIYKELQLIRQHLVALSNPPLLGSSTAPARERAGSAGRHDPWF